MIRYGLFATLLVGFAGCLTPPPAEPIQTAHPAPLSATQNPVRADQVTAQNAHQMAQALADELDRDTQKDISAQPKR
jgi:hypothetical protein